MEEPPHSVRGPKMKNFEFASARCSFAILDQSCGGYDMSGEVAQ